MDRRQFIRRGFVYSALGTLYASTIGKLFAGSRATESMQPYDLVAVRGGEPVEMYRRAISELGGMEAFVKPGQTVAIKPNASWDVPPERGGNTNPALMKAIVEDCLAAGASRVFAFDNTCDNWESAYANSGVEAAVRAGGGQMIPANQERNYQEVQVPGGKSLTTTKVHERLLQSDVLINVPILKHHASTLVTIGMKNLMGLVWDRRFMHRNDLNQCIADFCLYRKPDLNIVDAYLVMTQNGPRGTSEADLTRMRSLMISKDIVAVDAAGAMMLGHDPREIGHLRIGAEMGLGQIDLDKLNIQRINL